MSSAVTARPRANAAGTTATDALVAFGISGDLAKQMTFRSLYRLERRGLLLCPILGVAVDDWSDGDLRAAMRGDATRFTRQDSVEEQWRIMQPLLNAPPPVHPYAKGTWGPAAGARGARRARRVAGTVGGA